MLTFYEVIEPDGSSRRCTTLQEARELVAGRPEVEVRPIVRYRACRQHPAYEPANCPLCGTAPRIS